MFVSADSCSLLYPILTRNLLNFRSDLDDLENSFFEETEVDYNVEDDVSQSDHVEGESGQGGADKESDSDSRDDASSSSSSSGSSSSSSSSSSSEDEAIKQFVRDKMDGVVLKSPARTIQQKGTLSLVHIPMEKIIENACDGLSLMEDESVLSGSIQQDERTNNKVEETRKDSLLKLSFQETGMRDEGSLEEEMAEKAAFKGEMLHKTDAAVWSDVEEKAASEQSSAVDKSKAEVTVTGDKGVDCVHNNDPDIEGVVPPWIGFPPWGCAAIGKGGLRFRKCHGAYGYRGVYGFERKTTPSKTFESIQRIQRFSQQPT